MELTCERGFILKIWGEKKNRNSYPFHYLLISQLTIYLLCVCYGPGTKDVRVK